MKERCPEAESHRRSIIERRLARMELRPGATLSTGFPAIDEALGGAGLPRGRIIEIFGPPDSGKTTLALQIAAHGQTQGITAAWLDTERTFDPAYAAALGVSVENLPVMRPDSAESAMAMLHRLARSRAVDLLIVDSAAALVPTLELEAGIGDQSVGLQTRVLASGLRTLVRLAASADAGVIFLNHAGKRRDAAGEESETSAGGAALKLHAAIRISLRSTGGGTRFRVLKNRVAAAFATGELPRGPGQGFVKSP